MAEVVRHATYELHGDNVGTIITLKKWSTTKLFVMIRDLGAIIEEALGGYDGGVNEVILISRLIVSLCSSEGRAIRIVLESIEKPELSSNDVMNWDPEDFVGVLTKIFEMNLTEELAKNFRKLLGSVMGGAKEKQES